MRILAMLLVLMLLLAACGQPAGSVRTASMRAQLADVPSEIPVAGPVNPDPRVGPIFLGVFNLHTCTGSVVHSSTGDLILTAAHCLAKGFTTTFVPGFANAAAPSNVWTVDAVYLDPLWVAFKDPRVDYAFARVSRPGGGSIEAQFGSALLLGSAPAPGSQVRLIGYAAGVGALRSAAKPARGSPSGATPRSCARAKSTEPAARRGSSGRRSPGSPAASGAAGVRNGCRIQRRLTNAPQRCWPVPKPGAGARPRRSPSSVASCRSARKRWSAGQSTKLRVDDGRVQIPGGKCSAQPLRATDGDIAGSKHISPGSSRPVPVDERLRPRLNGQIRPPARIGVTHFGAAVVNQHPQRKRGIELFCRHMHPPFAPCRQCADNPGEVGAGFGETVVVPAAIGLEPRFDDSGTLQFAEPLEQH